MRIFLAVLLAIIFAVLFIAAVTINRVKDTAGGSDYLVNLLDDVDAYNYGYDTVLDALLTDITNKGFDITGGATDTTKTIKFDDPERVKRASLTFIEEVLPREYVRAKTRETVQGAIRYFTGRSDEFDLDLETQERTRRVPAAVRAAAEEIDLGELITDQFIAPTIRDLAGELTENTFGIEFTAADAEDAARRVIPPDWIEEQIFQAVDELVPYVAGEESTFNVRIDVRDRIPIAGEVLKEKLTADDSTIELVFDRVVDPLIHAAVSDINVLSFRVEITEEEIDEAIEAVAPPSWVRDQANRIIDEFVEYLSGRDNRLDYVVDLTGPKEAAVEVITDLALRKLNEQLAVIRTCTGIADATAAGGDVTSGLLPRCIPGGADELITAIMTPTIEAGVSDLILGSVPDRITYTDAEFRAQLGAGNVNTLDDLRSTIANGVSYSSEDFLLDFIGNSDFDEAEDRREIVRIIRSGIRFDETDFRDLANGRVNDVDEVRDWIGRSFSFWWLIFTPALLLLLVVTLVGGRSWPGRFKWFGVTLLVVSLLSLVVVRITWSVTGTYRDDAVVIESLSEEFRADFPALTRVIESEELQDKLNFMLDDWAAGLGNANIPFIIAGAIVAALAWLYPRYVRYLPARFGGPGGTVVTDPGSYGDAWPSTAPPEPNREPEQEAASSTNDRDGPPDGDPASSAHSAEGDDESGPPRPSV